MTQPRAQPLPESQPIPGNAEAGLARTVVHSQEELRAGDSWDLWSLEANGPSSPSEQPARSSVKARGFFAWIQRTGQSSHKPHVKAHKLTSPWFAARLSHSNWVGVGGVSVITTVII